MNIGILLFISYAHIIIGIRVAIGLFENGYKTGSRCVFVSILIMILFGIFGVVAWASDTPKINEVEAPIHTAPNGHEYYFYDGQYYPTNHISRYRHGDRIIVEEYEQKVFGFLYKPLKPIKIKLIESSPNSEV